MSCRHRPTPEFPEHLRALYAHFPFDRSLAQDPLSLVRPHAGRPRAAEVAGVVAATLAIGNTTAIRGAFTDFQSRVGGDLESWVRRSERTAGLAGLTSFRHRWIRGDQVAFLGRTLAETYASYGSLEELFLEGFQEGGFASGIDTVARRLRGAPGSGEIPRGYARLFPSPMDPSHSPCKRLTLYLRWMVRPAYPDLGLWKRVPTGELRIPLDQHVHWIAYHLGLTARRSRTWTTVEEVTASLRRIDPVDPTRFDFVLCHTGISGDCPKERDMAVCGPCLVRPDCLLWRGRAPPAA